MPVDLSGQIYDSFQRALAQAKLNLEKGRTAESGAAYRQCATYLERYAGYSKSATIKARWLKQAQEYLRLAERVESGHFAVPTTTGETPATADDYEDAVTRLIHKSEVAWADIAGLEETKKEIKSAYGLSLARKPAGVRLEGWRNILLYGPPGTGKTLLAAATSSGLDATFFNVVVPDLLSKFFGESSKLIGALYQTARQLAPAVVYLDEFEALSPARDAGQSGPEGRIVSTFLAELDGLAQKSDARYVLTIAATNLPWLIDRAVLSRFAKRIYVPLPDEEARRRLLELQLDRRGHHSELSHDQLGAQTAGYSGREIAAFCGEAIKEMVNRLNPDLTAAVDAGREALGAYQIKVGPVGQRDWQLALERVRPGTTEADLRRFRDWAAALN